LSDFNHAGGCRYIWKKNSQIQDFIKIPSALLEFLNDASGKTDRQTDRPAEAKVIGFFSFWTPPIFKYLLVY
jgi:hypothetical protein